MNLNALLQYLPIATALGILIWKFFSLSERVTKFETILTETVSSIKESLGFIRTDIKEIKDELKTIEHNIDRK
jgi:hypothetical protein